MGAPALTNPGMDVAVVQLFDPPGHMLGEWSFWPGPNVKEARVALSHHDGLGVDVISVASGTEMIRPAAARQYFAFAGDVLYLVRLENDEGQIVQNSYYPCTPLGVLPDAKGIDEWIAMLRSRETVRILAALTYLGGEFHSASRPQSWIGDPERLKVESIRVLRADDRIRALVSRHVIADQPWIREAAELALREIR